MCTMMAAGLAISAASTAVSLLSSEAQHQTSSALARRNAQVLDQTAEDAAARGEVAETIQRQKTASIAGAQRASMGASGFKVDEGSFGDVLEQTVATGELDALTIRSNAMREAWGHQSDATMQRWQASQPGPLKSLLTGGGKSNRLNFINL